MELFDQNFGSNFKNFESRSRVEFLLKTESGYLSQFQLRVEFLLKTESGYLRDAEVT